MSRISEYAKKNNLPLVVACGKGIEGDGVLYSITKDRAVVRYDGFDQSYKLPEEIDDFVLVDPIMESRVKNPFQKYIKVGGITWPNDDYGHYLQTKHIKSLTPDTKHALAKEFPIRSKFVSRYQGEDKVRSHEFFGEKAGDITFADERDFVVALAYIAAPGKCSLVADVPPNHYADFEDKFPHTSYGHIESHSGGTCQFTLLFHGDVSDMPPCLASEVMPSDEMRIIRSAFAYELVDHRGFVFGAEQDLENIRNAIPTKYKELFDTYLAEFSQNTELEEADEKDM